MSDIEAARMAVENHELRTDHAHSDVYARLVSLEDRLGVLESSAAEQASLAQAAAQAAQEQAIMAQQAADVAEQAAASAEESATEETPETTEELPAEESTDVSPDTIPEVTHPVFRRLGARTA